MNADQEAGVLAAAKQLSIKDVVLASCRFERPARGVPDVGTEVHQAHKRGVEYQIIEVDSEGARERQLQVLVELRSEEHTSELQSLMRISYAVFCLKKKKKLRLTSNEHIDTK